MRRRFAALFLAAVMVLSLSGCSKYTIGEKPSEPEVKTSTEVTAETSVSTETSAQEESQVSEEEPDYADMPLWDPIKYEYDDLYRVYYPLIRDAYHVLFFKMPYEHDCFYCMGAETDWFEQDDLNKIGFCFYDINGDGLKEFIAGYKDSIYAIASFDPDTYDLYSLFYGGYRSFVNVLKDGRVEDGGSSGAMSYEIGYRTFDSHGNVTTTDFYFTAPDAAFENVAYFHNETGAYDTGLSEEITEEEFGKATSDHDYLTFAADYTPFADSADNCDGVGEPVSLENIRGTAWGLRDYYIEGVRYDGAYTYRAEDFFITEDDVIKYGVYQNGEMIFSADCELEYDEHRGHLYFSYDDPEIGERVSARIVRKLDDGSLLIQSGWSEFSEEKGYKEHYTDKYFVPAVG